MNTHAQAYAYCQQLAHTHYENFPVASILLPRHLRAPIAAIYAFARSADDIADEGIHSQETRLTRLALFSRALDDSATSLQQEEAFIFQALHDAIERFDLPTQYLHDLLHAFKQDVRQTHYQHFSDILTYTRYSAQPVGRLLLHLTQSASDSLCLYSDYICTALQLINFYQDIYQDITVKHRYYIPLTELQAADLSIEQFYHTPDHPLIQTFMYDQITRAYAYLLKGAPLGWQLKGRFGIEIRAIILTALSLSTPLLQRKNIKTRPTLAKHALLNIAIKALSPHLFKKHIKKISFSNISLCFPAFTMESLCDEQ